MKKQLKFDFDLLWMKKKYLFPLLLGNILYFIIVLTTFNFNSFLGTLLTMFMMLINTGVIYSILYCSISFGNSSVANYALCRYFPVRRRDYYASKLFIGVLLFLFQIILSLSAYVCSCAIHNDAIEKNTIIVLVLAIYFVVVFSNSIAMITGFSGSAYQLGFFASCSLGGMTAGGFAAFLNGGIEKLSMLFVAIFLAVVTAVMIFSIWLGLFISKKASI